MKKKIYSVVYSTKVVYLEGSAKHFNTLEEAKQHLDNLYKETLSIIAENNDNILDNSKGEDAFTITTEDNKTWDIYYDSASIQEEEIEIPDKYILIETFEREIRSTEYATEEEAINAMKEALLECAGYDSWEEFEEENERHEDYDFNATYYRAWFNGRHSTNYDWLIVKVVL